MSNGTTSGDILSFGLRGSGFADSTLITGFISAFRQFGREMVSTDGQISTTLWENQSDGSRRLTLHTTWGRDISEGQGIPANLQLPVISTLCQLSGPPLNERDYGAVETFVRRLNDEILFRMLTYEIPLNQVVPSWTAINLLENVMQDIPKKDIIRFLRRTEKNIEITLDQILNQDLPAILRENPKLLKKLLTLVPLQSSCSQDQYEMKIQGLHDYLAAQKEDFLKWDSVLQKSQDFIKIEQKFLEKIKKEYQGFSDKYLTFYENKNAIFWALEKLIQVFNDLRTLLKPINDSLPVQDLFKIIENFPHLDKFDDYITKINQNDVTFLQILNVLNPDTSTKILKLLDSKVPESLSRGESLLRQLQDHLHAFSDLLAKTNKLSQELSKKRPLLQDLYKQIIGGRPRVEEMNVPAAGNMEGSNETQLLVTKSAAIPPKCDQESVLCAQQNMKANFLHSLIDVLYSRSLQDHLNFKYALIHNGSLKDAFFQKVLLQMSELEHEIQDFSLAALLNRSILLLKTKFAAELKPLKKHTITLLANFLKFFLRDSAKQDPFLKKQEIPVLAIDSYSREFCANIILRADLKKDILNVIGEIIKLEEHKTEFLQILESSNNGSLNLPKSPVEAKLHFRALLIKALLNTYTDIYEDYFGRILPLDASNPEVKQTLVTGKLWKFLPGKYIQKQYTIITTEMECYFGLKNLFYFINALNHRDFKTNSFDFRYVINYLSSYYEESFKFVRDLICTFSNTQGFLDFFQFARQKFDAHAESLVSQIKQIYEKTLKLVNGASPTIPHLSFEMRMLNNELIETLTGIIDNYVPQEKELFRDGLNAPKGHPARIHNLVKLEKRYQQFFEKLPPLSAPLAEDVKELHKFMRVISPKYPSYLEYSSKVFAGIEGNLSPLTRPNGLNFHQFLQIQTGSLLDPIRYVLPDEITQKLTVEKQLTETKIINLTKISKEVQAILNMGVLEALEKSSQFRDFFALKPQIHLPDRYSLELNFEIPETIEPDVRKKIFTQDLFVFDKASPKRENGQKHILGLNLPSNIPFNKERTLNDLINDRVSQEIYEEVEPIYALVDQYAQEAHSGFKHVFEMYFGQLSKNKEEK